MADKNLKLATSKQKKHYRHFLASGEEVIAVFGIGDRYFWYTVSSYLMIIFFLAVYPLILRNFEQFDVLNRYGNLIFIPAVLVALIGAPFILRLIHLKHRMSYIFTDRRVLIKDGVLSVKLTSAPYDKITHLAVREDFLKKISYQIGDITIHTAGPTPIETDIIKVQYPMKVKNLLEELIVKERSLLGVVSEDKEPLIKSI